MIEAVLCDIDGTLVDSNSQHAEAWRRALEHFGISVSYQDVLRQIGKGGDQLVPYFVPGRDLPHIEKSLKEYRKKLFHSEFFDSVKPFPGARELLEKMRAAGLRIAVASSSNKEDLGRLKEIAQISDLVEKETSSGDADKSKPEPDIFEAALERLKLRPEEAVALGDTRWDMEAATKAGIRAMAVTSGAWSEGELREAGAIEVYLDVADLSRRFDTSILARRQATPAKVSGTAG
jgi:HAD superfamily hydrolase (TIGR01509 family)